MPASPRVLRLQRPVPAGPGGTPSLGAPPRTTVRDRSTPDRAPAGARAYNALRSRPELLGILLLAGILNLWSLSTNGDANTYYAAAVKSMAGSWHDFLYGSFDASGVMTVDKPPAAFWVQALSVRVFGYSSWAMLVPQALMGVATVGLVYDLVRRRFGRAAGAIGGLALALTPISVAISRHNNPDALLILCVVGAVWAMVRALEDGRTRWLVLCGACVGLGFETKMGAGLLVAPGLAAAWLWVAPKGRLAALRCGLAGAGTAIAVGGAWPLLVALTPAGSRPWISGTTDNSIWSLITQYNGLGRLSGQTGGPGGGMGGGGAGGVFGGDTGVLRLLHASLGGQAGWLLGFGLVAALALTVTTRLRRTDAATGWLLVVGGGFAASLVAFSFAAGIFHPYYVSELAPFTAMLVGAGAGVVLRGGQVSRIVGPLLLAGGIATEVVVLHEDATDLAWLVPVVAIVGGLAAGALAAVDGTTIRRTALGVGVGALLLGSAIWSVQTLGHATSSTFPAGGPTSASTMGGPGGGGRGGFGGGAPGGQGTQSGTAGGFPGTAGGTAGTQGGTAGAARAGAASAGGAGGGGMFGGQDLTSSLSYITAHGGGTLAVESQQGAADAIIKNGSAVVGIGGFSGRESTVSTAWLANAVKAGKIRYVLVSSTGGGMGGDTRQGSAAAMTAAAKVGKTTTVTGLYDLAGQGDALAALAAS